MLDMLIFLTYYLPDILKNINELINAKNWHRNCNKVIRFLGFLRKDIQGGDTKKQ